MSVVFRRISVDGSVSKDSGGRTRSLPSEMPVVCGQARYFQHLAEFRLLKIVERGPGGNYVRLTG